MWLNTIQTPSSLLPESIGTMQTMHILYQDNSHVYMDTCNQLKNLTGIEMLHLNQLEDFDPITHLRSLTYLDTGRLHQSLIREVCM